MSSEQNISKLELDDCQLSGKEIRFFLKSLVEAKHLSFLDIKMSESMRCPIIKDKEIANDESELWNLSFNQTTIKRFSTLNLGLPLFIETFEIEFQVEKALTQIVKDLDYWCQQEETKDLFK